MSTCNRLDLQTLGSQPVIMSKNPPDNWDNVTVDDFRVFKVSTQKGHLTILDSVCFRLNGGLVYKVLNNPYSVLFIY